MLSKNLLPIALCLILIFTTGLPCKPQSTDTRHSLWYQQPADEWMKSLPIGNGRIGVTVFGGTFDETISLSEITLWAGQYDEDQHRKCGKEKLNEIRKYFFEGNLSKGNQLGSDILSGSPHSFGSHVPLGDLKMHFRYSDNNISEYKRELDLKTAINKVSFKAGDVLHTREYFCSNPDDVLIINMSADKANNINTDISFQLLREADIIARDNSIEIEGKVSFPKQGPGGVEFNGRIAVKTKDGTVSAKGGVINISQASNVTLVFDLRTDYENKDYKNQCTVAVNNALSKKYTILKDNHIADHSDLYNRVDLFFGESPNDKLPTDKRWESVKNGATDIGLDALFFNYARYLLIAASRANSPLPANLQGVWNDNLACNMAWTNDYHLDINTQQNYWLANIGNLHELNEPLFKYIAQLAKYGSRTAKDVYGARGWTAHTVANVWGYTASGSGVGWGLFPTAGAWIASHLWTHYLYTSDRDFLEKTAYPLLKGQADFLVDYLVKDPNTGYLMTGPSISPENSFRYEEQNHSLSMMPTVDLILVRETFNSCIEASKILNVDSDYRSKLTAILKQLPTFKIGRNGGLQEWFEDYDEAQPNHRHTSHLLAIYPFQQITPNKNPDLANAVRRTMELRLAAKDWEDVEWSRANMICNYARLYDSEKAYESLVLLQRNLSRENLLTISPKGIAGAPYDIFIFDGNEAGGAGIAEMLIQCHEGYIDLLPALPKAWSNGYFKGLAVRNGATVDAEWKDSKLNKVIITATISHSFVLKHSRSKDIPSFFKSGKQVKIRQKGDGYIRFDLKKDEALELIYNH
ncbi:glycoside hydrolase family 95 protein [Dysgonomonas sp. Marseille-P4677]|uniref:glycoside hydrolase family 95 protein n=1 Tax=Dysgonomonas sp. Marseille-P4677 TaxID=2364790 RepID=UPI001911C598|nr:glycoside hydrolase family 95 protein [Dysgonomonas sp. Marseille-P4677]MBK5721056.1 glycoside hydrolase family 95 protein [Dysgonomonas sp. Marseille-P4677]